MRGSWKSPPAPITCRAIFSRPAAGARRSLPRADRRRRARLRASRPRRWQDARADAVPGTPLEREDLSIRGHARRLRRFAGPPLPPELRALAQEIAARRGWRIDPDLCILNYYDADGRMGLHQDKDEGPASIAAGIPVVSVSLGDTARFLFGGLKRRDPVEAIALESGDAFVFGGPARLRYHGVSRITPARPAELGSRALQSHLPAIRRSMPRVVVIGAGAAGTMAAIFAASRGRRDAAARAHEGRRPQDPHQRRRPLQHPARALDESRFVTDSSPHTLRNIVRSWPLREQIAFFERDSAAAHGGDGVGEAVSEVGKRARRARQAARPGARAKA